MMMIVDDAAKGIRPVKLGDVLVDERLGTNRPGIAARVITRTSGGGVRLQYDDNAIAFTFYARLATDEDEVVCQPEQLAA